MEMPGVASNYTTHLFSIQAKYFVGEKKETRSMRRLVAALVPCCPCGSGAKERLFFLYAYESGTAYHHDWHRCASSVMPEGIARRIPGPDATYPGRPPRDSSVGNPRRRHGRRGDTSAARRVSRVYRALPANARHGPATGSGFSHRRGPNKE